MLKKLIKLAERLDSIGEYEFADKIDKVILSAGWEPMKSSKQLYDEINERFGPGAPETEIAGRLMGNFPEHEGKRRARLFALIKVLEQGRSVDKVPAKEDEFIKVDDMVLSWPEFEAMSKAGPEVWKKAKESKIFEERTKKMELLKKLQESKIPKY
jgi:hypothetical protein